MRLIQLPIILFAVVVSFAVAAKHHRQLPAIVESVSMDFGNIDTGIGASELESIGLAQGDTFIVGFGDKEFEVYWGNDYSDVPQGDWVAFITSTETLRIARNYENAAVTLGVKAGDEMTLFN